MSAVEMRTGKKIFWKLEGDMGDKIDTHTHAHTHIHIYIYIYIGATAFILRINSAVL